MPRETLTTLKIKISELDEQVKDLTKKNAAQMRFINEMNVHYLSLISNTMTIVRSATDVKASIVQFLKESGMQTEPSPNLPPVPLVPVVPPSPPAVEE